MSGFYRKKTNALMALLKDKGFYVILSLSLVMVLFAAYLALNWDSNPQGDTGDPQQILGVDPLDPNYVPEWPDEILSTDVVANENDITVEIPEENGGTEKEVTEVKYIMPIDYDLVVSVNEYTGTTPVFSETLNDWRLHNGVDFITDEPCDVYAAADGIVEDFYEDGFMGTSVLLLHEDGSRTLYQSLSPNVRVIKGMEVYAGDVIGKTGATAEEETLEGCHLHYELIKNGAQLEPVIE